MTTTTLWTWALTAWLAVPTPSLNAAEQQPAKEISAGMQAQPKLVIKPDDLFPLTRPTRLGMFTVVPPQRNGEVFRLSVPVGELLSQATRAISDANHRRAERQADERVRKDLERFPATAR